MLVEWGLTPDYIFDNWTEEVFSLMVEKLVARKARELDAVKKKHSGDVKVSEKTLFAQAGKNIKVVEKKHGN